MTARALRGWRRAELAKLFIAFLSLHVLTLVFFRPGGFVVDWSDYYFFRSWATYTDRGLFPYLHFWMEHPPVFPWFNVLAYRVSLLLPFADPRLSFSLAFGLLLLPFEAGNLWLVYRLVRRLGGTRAALRAGWAYTLLGAPLYFWAASFDALVLFLLLWALLSLLEGRPLVAGFATGLGVMAKVIPLVLVPVALRVDDGRRQGPRPHPDPARRAGTYPPGGCGAPLPEGAGPHSSVVGRRSSVIYLASTAATVAAVALPFLIANPTMTLASARSLLARSSWETVWALLDGYYSGGVVAPIGDRLDAQAAEQVQHASALPWAGISLAFLAVYAALVLLPLRWRRPRTAVAFAGLTLNGLLLYSKGWSPQFIVYILPFALLALPFGRAVAYCLALTAANVAEYPLALLLFPNQAWALTLPVLARTALLVTLSLDYLLAARPDWRRPAWRALSRAALAATLAALAALVPLFGLAFARQSLAADPYLGLVRALKGTTGTVVVTSPRLYERLYPHLNRSTHLRADADGASIAADLAAGPVALVFSGEPEDGPANDRAARTLAATAFQVEDRWLENARVRRFAAAALPEREIGARLGEAIRLERAAFRERLGAGEPVLVSLTWSAERPLAGELKVFVHLVGPDGRPVRQDDSLPMLGLAPLPSWTPGTAVIDRHALPAAPPGRYRLRAGLYDAESGVRLPVTGGATGDAVDLGDVEIGP